MLRLRMGLISTDPTIRTSPRQRCRILMACQLSSPDSHLGMMLNTRPRPKSSRYRPSVSPRRPLWPPSGMTSTPPRALTTRNSMPRSRVRLPPTSSPLLRAHRGSCAAAVHPAAVAEFDDPNLDKDALELGPFSPAHILDFFLPPDLAMPLQRMIPHTPRFGPPSPTPTTPTCP